LSMRLVLAHREAALVVTGHGAVIEDDFSRDSYSEVLNQASRPNRAYG
jgi:hypothetical protein